MDSTNKEEQRETHYLIEFYYKDELARTLFHIPISELCKSDLLLLKSIQIYMKDDPEFFDQIIFTVVDRFFTKYLGFCIFSANSSDIVTSCKNYEDNINQLKNINDITNIVTRNFDDILKFEDELGIKVKCAIRYNQNTNATYVNIINIGIDNSIHFIIKMDNMPGYVMLTEDFE